MKEKKDRKIRSSIVRDSLDTFGTNVFGSLLGLIASLLVLNRVQPAVKGLYNTVQLWGGGFSSLLGLSVNAAIIYFVSRYKIQNTKRAVRRLTLWISAAIVVVGALCMFLLRDSAFFAGTPVSYLVAIVIYGVSSMVLNNCIAILRGENKFRSYNMVVLIQRILVFALAMAIFLHPSAAVWVWATILISLLMILLSLYSIRDGAAPCPFPRPRTISPCIRAALCGTA